MSPSPNADTLEVWNTKMAEKWIRHRDVVARGLAVHSEAAVRLFPPRAGDRVLDVGCGMGDLTRALAQAVGPDGLAVGVDGAERFVAFAREEAAALSNVRFLRADVEVDRLEGPYDGVYSRFGTMFFADPVAAFRNIRSELAPGRRLCMIVWRRREENVFFVASQSVVDRVCPAPGGRPDPDAPGPFSLASADRVSDILVRAGFSRVGLERHDGPYVIGQNLDRAVEIALAFGPAGERLRSGELDDAQRERLAAGLREAFAPYVESAGVATPSSVWIVTATA